MTTSKKKSAGKISLVGGGLGPAELLTVKAAAALAAADVVVADHPVTDELKALIRNDEVEFVDASQMSPADTVKHVTTAAKAGRAVVRLLVGDPFADSEAAMEAEALHKAKLSFDVVPGISRVFGGPTYIGVPLHSSIATAGVGALPDPADQQADWTSFASPRRLAVGTVHPTALPLITARLFDAGRAPNTPAIFVWEVGTPAQRTVSGTLETLPGEVSLYARDEEGLVVIGDAVGHRSALSWFEAKPMFGWHVLVPRTKDPTVRVLDRLRDYGAVPIEVPTIAVEPPRTSAPMDRAIKGLISGRYQWCLFTSPNSFRAIREKFEEVGLDSRAFAGLKLAALGAETIEAIRVWGIEPDLMPDPGKTMTEELAAIFPPFDDVFDPISRVLIPRADVATDALCEDLTAKGWECDEVTAYRTVRAAPPPAPIRDAIKGGGFDAVMFTSASTVRNLVGIAGKPHQSTIIGCIGPATVTAAEELGLRVDVVAPEPEIMALAEALADHAYSRREQGLPQRPAARAPKPPKPRARGSRRRLG